MPTGKPLQKAKGRILLRELALGVPNFRRPGDRLPIHNSFIPESLRTCGQNPHILGLPVCLVVIAFPWPTAFSCPKRASLPMLWLTLVPLSSLKDFSSVATEYCTRSAGFYGFISVQIAPELCKKQPDFRPD
ncbi:MAG: hypothetical protein ACYCPO_13365 [Acidobacteriaceae bacterium]